MDKREGVLPVGERARHDDSSDIQEPNGGRGNVDSWESDTSKELEAKVDHCCHSDSVILSEHEESIHMRTSVVSTSPPS